MLTVIQVDGATFVGVPETTDRAKRAENLRVATKECQASLIPGFAPQGCFLVVISQPAEP